MILCYHPILKGDRKRICAGRELNDTDLHWMRRASAILLPQGCREDLYQAASRFCRRVFPNYQYRFRFPGKIGDIRLFRAFHFPHPKTWLFSNVSTCPAQFWRTITYPVVLKSNYGGEGNLVFLVEEVADAERILAIYAGMERSGLHGFLVQQWIPTDHRDLRVVIMGDRLYSYWRVQTGTEVFYHNLAKGAVIDQARDPELQAIGIRWVRELVRQTGINLAGLDLIFPFHDGKLSQTPLFLEINYYFGRKGLGGSEEYYRLLQDAVDEWLCNG